MKALFSVVVVLAVVAIAIPTFAGDCYKKCVSEKSVCIKTVNQCVQQGLKCIRTESICTSRDRKTGQCLSTQERCAQYQQVCTQYKEVCVQYDKTCAQYQTVCPDSKPQPAGQQKIQPSGSKALDQLKAIDQGRDSIFDGGPGSTLNRQ